MSLSISFSYALLPEYFSAISLSLVKYIPFLTKEVNVVLFLLEFKLKIVVPFVGLPEYTTKGSSFSSTTLEALLLVLLLFITLLISFLALSVNS